MAYVVLIDQYSESDFGDLYEAYRAKDLKKVKEIIKAFVDDGGSVERITVLKVFSQDLDFKVTKTVSVEFL